MKHFYVNFCVFDLVYTDITSNLNIYTKYAELINSASNFLYSYNNLSRFMTHEVGKNAVLAEINIVRVLLVVHLTTNVVLLIWI